MKSLLVDTTPRGFKRNATINPGLNMVALKWKADVVHWTEKVNCTKYDRIGFNVFYPMNVLNVWPFVKNNNLENAHFIGGGQGISNIGGFAEELFPEVFRGEIDGKIQDKNGYWRAKCIDTQPIINKNKAIIETTRGCKYKCSFCEYGCILGGKYREKPLDIIKEQINNCGAYSINLFSMNLAGYSKIDELLDYIKFRNIRILNNDSCLIDVHNLNPLLKSMNHIRLGIESFDEKTRRSNGKNFTDNTLFSTIKWLSKRINYIYLYLIYGLPGDNYDYWIDALYKLAEIRDSYNVVRKGLFNYDIVKLKPMRFDFSITPFEPGLNTPHSKSNMVDFNEMHKFKKRWVDAMSDCGFYIKRYENPQKAPGKFGKGELSYNVLMKIKKGGSDVVEAAKNRFKNGIGVSLPKKAAQLFLTD